MWRMGRHVGAVPPPRSAVVRRIVKNGFVGLGDRRGGGGGESSLVRRISPSMFARKLFGSKEAPRSNETPLVLF